MLMLLQVI